MDGEAVRHAAQRRPWRNRPEALTVTAVHYITNRPMPAPSGAGRHRHPEDTE